MLSLFVDIIQTFSIIFLKSDNEVIKNEEYC